MAEDRIVIRGARQNNLKGIDVTLPKERFIVITGVSGSGKSSLAFDTLFAEGRRRYMESLSSQARLFLHSLPPPLVDSIDGLSPAIAIEPKGTSRNPRSTVGTLTEIHDHLRILFTHLGRVHCPHCQLPIEAFSVPEMAEAVVKTWPEGSRLFVLAPQEPVKASALVGLLQSFRRNGFARIRFQGTIFELDPLPALPRHPSYRLDLVVDRIVLHHDRPQRLMEALELALKHSHGGVAGLYSSDGQERYLSETLRCTSCGREFEKPTPSLFSFHHPKGACATCHGLGITLLESRGKPSSKRTHVLFDETVDALFSDEGELLETDAEAWSDRTCNACGGSRFNDAARSVHVGELSLDRVLSLPATDLMPWISNLFPAPRERAICERPLHEISSRLQSMLQLGLGYLSMDRSAISLSGGEAQRLRIAQQVNASLSGIIYVLDEPSIGLHARDHGRLLELLLRLRDEGNTVVVVEHDRDTILRADYVVDIGPGAGELGGELLFQGIPEDLMKCSGSLTGAYISGSVSIPTPTRRPCFENGALTVVHARGHCLKGITVRFPLGCFTCVTGVSGSGKSTLVMDTLYRALAGHFYRSQRQPAVHDRIEGIDLISKVLVIDQLPIGRTPRSCPASYSNALKPIRELFSRLPESRARGYSANRFSYNVKGGRCESCKGDGDQKIEMYFLPDVYVTCPYCSGQRYNSETLAILYKGKSIADVLKMTFFEAAAFFKNIPAVRSRIEPFIEVGLGYLKLGQPATTLSGGEAQRIKLATELARKAPPKSLFILDEPTTGLHSADVQKLIHTLQSLVDQGHTVIVIEHHLDMIKSADYVMDMGPEGGAGGGTIVGEGTPEELSANPASITGRYLRCILRGHEPG